MSSYDVPPPSLDFWLSGPFEPLLPRLAEFMPKEFTKAPRPPELPDPVELDTSSFARPTGIR